MRGMDTPPPAARYARLLARFLARFHARLPRMFGWLAVAVLLGCTVAVLAPQQLAVSLYKLSLVSMAAVAGYWLDRSLFPYARPDAVSRDALLAPVDGLLAPVLLFVGCMLRRAVVVAAAMLAVGMGA